MTLLTPLFLMALPLLAIPIVLHLWRKRRRNTLPWGAMQFLINDDHRQRKFSNIDRWLVLLARCLTLLFLIAALARPLLHSQRYGRIESRTDDILVIDQSLSSSRLDDRGEPVIELIRQRAKEWVNSRPEGSTLRILTTAGRPQWLADSRAYGGVEATILLKKLDELRSINARSDLTSAVRFAATTDLKDQDETAEAKRRVWVLTDGQASDWHLSTAEAFETFCLELERESDVEINIGIAGGAANRVANLGLSPLRANSWRKSPGERLRVTAQVVNDAKVQSPGATAIWTIAGNEISRETFGPLQPGESKILEAGAVIQEAGTRVVACQLRVNDSLVADNRSIGVVEILDRIPILLVSDTVPSPSRIGEAEFFQAALGHHDTNDRAKSDAADDRIWQSVFHAARITSRDIAGQNLDKFDAIVMLDSLAISTTQMQRLTEYVHRGGGLWISLGDQTDLRSFNEDWHAGGLGLAPVVLNSLNVVHADNAVGDTIAPATNQKNSELQPDQKIHPPERDHPTVQWLSDSTKTDLDEVLIHRFYAASQPDSSSNARVLLRTGGGNPISTLSSHGKGRVIIQTLPMNPTWTNWPLTGSFVVMVDSWLRHLTEPRHSALNLAPGSPLRLRIPITASVANPEVELPSGQKSIVGTKSLRDVCELRFSQTYESGLYQVRWSKPSRGKDTNNAQRNEKLFAVSRPPEESVLESLPETYLNRLDGLANTSLGSVVENPSAWLRGGGTGGGDSSGSSHIPKLPIWTPLLYGLLLFLVVELFLSGFASIRRFGRRTTKEGEEELFTPTLDMPSGNSLEPARRDVKTASTTCSEAHAQ